MSEVYRCPFCGEFQIRPICYNHPPLKVSWIYRMHSREELYEITFASPDYYQIILQIYSGKTYLFFDENVIAETDLLSITPDTYSKYKHRLLGMKAFL